MNSYRPEVVLRTVPKVKMKCDFTDKERVRRSPYYLCIQLWDKLTSAVQKSSSMYEFSKSISRMDLVEF